MYDAERSWRDVDAYFVETLIDEDDALVQARESCALTTMPHAEVAPTRADCECPTPCGLSNTQRI